MNDLKVFCMNTAAAGNGFSCDSEMVTTRMQRLSWHISAASKQHVRAGKNTKNNFLVLCIGRLGHSLNTYQYIIFIWQAKYHSHRYADCTNRKYFFFKLQSFNFPSVRYYFYTNFLLIFKLKKICLLVYDVTQKKQKPDLLIYMTDFQCWNVILMLCQIDQI